MLSKLSAKARGMIRAASEAGDLRWRQPPRLTVASSAGRPPIVFYLAPDLVVPSGGVRNMYRHVDILNEAGIDAAVLHTRPGFRCTWFANDTRVVAAPQAVLTPADVLVIPECYGPGLHRLPAGIRTVVFNQGAYYTFSHIPYATTVPGAPYAGLADLVALLTVSDDNTELLRYTFPAIAVHQARVVVDGAVFHPAAGPGGRRIAYVANRRPEERVDLMHILRARGILDTWELVEIQGRTEAETAELMRSSPIFLSFSQRDGFGLPPAEAMASGCYVVGFTGLGGREFFDPAYCAAVPDSDLLAFARAVEDAIRRYEVDPASIVKLGRIASEQVLARYSRSGLGADLTTFYSQLPGGGTANHRPT